MKAPSDPNGNDSSNARLGWSESPKAIKDALDNRLPVWMRQIGGITWMRMTPGVDLTIVLNFDLFEYWIGPDHPINPASVDPEYPMHKRPKLRAVLEGARKDAREASAVMEPTNAGDSFPNPPAGAEPSQTQEKWAVVNETPCMANLMHGSIELAHMPKEAARTVKDAHNASIDRILATPAPKESEFDWAEMEPGKHELQFQCEWAVFPKNGNGSLCYVTSEERAKWIADRLNELRRLKATPAPPSATAHEDIPVYFNLAWLLGEIGWVASGDAQWTRLRDVIPRIQQLLSETTTDLGEHRAGLAAEVQGQNELLPCPFCGESPTTVLRTNESTDGAYQEIACENTKCPAQPLINENLNEDEGNKAWELAADRAFSAWNQRATPSVGGGLRSDCASGSPKSSLSATTLQDEILRLSTQLHLVDQELYGGDRPLPYEPDRILTIQLMKRTFQNLSATTHGETETDLNGKQGADVNTNHPSETEGV